VCQNTLSQALGQGHQFEWLHTSAMESRLTMRLTKHSLQSSDTSTLQRNRVQLRKLADVEMSEEHLDAYLRSVFPDPLLSKDEKQYRRAITLAQKDRQESRRLCFNGKGTTTVSRNTRTFTELRMAIANG
jgi:hypothetical protein